MSTQTQTQEGSNSDPQAWALQELWTPGGHLEQGTRSHPHTDGSLHISPTVWAKEAFGNQLGKLITIHNIVLQENINHCPRNKHLQ